MSLGATTETSIMLGFILINPTEYIFQQTILLRSFRQFSEHLGSRHKHRQRGKTAEIALLFWPIEPSMLKHLPLKPMTQHIQAPDMLL